MSNDVTIKLDARALYAFIAFIALIGVFGIAVWLGMSMAGTNQAPAPTAAQNQPVAPAVEANSLEAGGMTVVQGGGEGTSPQVQTNVGGQQQLNVGGGSDDLREMLQGGPPVSPDDVPIVEGEPRIWVGEVGSTDGFSFDIGTVSGIDVTSHEFAVTNIGSGELIIDRTTSACGCTIPELDKMTLAPGEETVLRVPYDPKVLQEQGQFVKKSVQIASNDPAAGVVEFTFMADVDTK